MFSPKDKSAKEAALKKLIGILDAGDREDVASLKKPSVTAIDVTSLKPHAEESESPIEELTESPSEEASESEPSDDEKAQISALYHKYCQ